MDVTMPVYPTPHSEEWFEALHKFSPRQAEMPRAIVNAAGRMDVCSICGDQPAADYELVDPTLDNDAVATIRLCDDCKITQGGNFQPFTNESAPPIKDKLMPLCNYQSIMA